MRFSELSTAPIPAPCGFQPLAGKNPPTAQVQVHATHHPRPACGSRPGLGADRPEGCAGAIHGGSPPSGDSPPGRRARASPSPSAHRRAARAVPTLPPTPGRGAPTTPRAPGPGASPVQSPGSARFSAGCPERHKQRRLTGQVHPIARTKQPATPALGDAVDLHLSALNALLSLSTGLGGAGPFQKNVKLDGVGRNGDGPLRHTPALAPARRRSPAGFPGGSG